MKNKKLIARCIPLFASILLLMGCTVKAEKAQIKIAVAASMFEAMEDIKSVYQEENPDIDILLQSGSSGSLRRQIEQGADIDIFISASRIHMDQLMEEGYLIDNQYETLVTNELVLITPYDSECIDSIRDLANNSAIIFAMGEPDSVPAGTYAQEVLSYYGIDQQMPNKTVLAKDVKEVLTWVALGEADAGMVYKTNALIEKKVKIVETADADTHQPIVYPMARLKTAEAKKETLEFEAFMLSQEAQQIFATYGFSEIR
jgi:molybdate transport system substrate-binding protein